MDRDARYLLDMLMAANRILDQAHGRRRGDLDQDLSLQETVYWQTCVIGEAAGHLTTEFREAHPEEPWHKIIGLRHRIIHGYGDIDNDIVWDVVTTYLPGLVALLSGLVPFVESNGQE